MFTHTVKPDDYAEKQFMTSRWYTSHIKAQAKASFKNLLFDDNENLKLLFRH